MTLLNEGLTSAPIVPSPHRRTVNLVRAPFERSGEFAEGGVEHRAHHGGEHAATKFVIDEEFDPRSSGLLVLEGPDVFEAAEGPVDIFDVDFHLRPIERDAAREALAD